MSKLRIVLETFSGKRYNCQLVRRFREGPFSGSDKTFAPTPWRGEVTPLEDIYLGEDLRFKIWIEDVNIATGPWLFTRGVMHYQFAPKGRKTPFTPQKG